VATHCTDGGEIWHGGGDLRYAKFHPYRCNDKGVGPPKLKFLLRLDRNVEYKRTAGACPLHDFHKICTVCTAFEDALGVKILLDLLKALWSYGGFKLRGLVAPNFKRHLAAKLCVRPPNVLEVLSSFLSVPITMPSLVGLGFHPPPGWPKTLSFFVCLSVCLFVRHAFERQRLCARFRYEGVGV